MWDLILFEKAPSADTIYVNAAQMNPNLFASTADSDKARVAAKRAKYLHFPAYEDDVGVIRTAKESGCTLLVAVSDFLEISPEQLGRRIGLARKFIWMSQHFGADVRLVSLAKNEWQLRDAREMTMIGVMLGFSAAQMKKQMDGEWKTR